MRRDEFVKKCLAIGVSLPFASFLWSCKKTEVIAPNFNVNFKGKVVVIGAGSAGLTAGYLLERHGVEFQILEASAQYGGRMKRLENFVDFPIDLGAEWIHASPTILAQMLSDPEANATVNFVNYTPQTIYTYNNGKLKKQNWANNFYGEYKFKDSTWFGFFEKYIAPKVIPHLSLDSPVTQIDHSGDKVLITTGNETIEADKVLITVPIKTLQDQLINFSPGLPSSYSNTINNILMGDGFKAFIEFSERFYPDVLLFGGLVNALTSDTKTYYDAAFRKDSNHHVLGLFSINEKAAQFTNLNSDQERLTYILNELDEIFEGKASQHYIKHSFQNWSQENYIRGSYSYNFDGNQQDMVNTLLTPIDNKLYFAGEALSIDNQATVHGASESAYQVVENLLRS